MRIDGGGSSHTGPLKKHDKADKKDASFKARDINKDGVLSGTETKGLKGFDGDANKEVSKDEFKAGTIKAFAIATPQRNPALPDVPTTTEAGLPDFQASAWNALFAPKGTPKPVIEKLEAALSKALDDEGVRKRLLALGSDIPGPDRRGQRPR